MPPRASPQAPIVQHLIPILSFLRRACPRPDRGQESRTSRMLDARTPPKALRPRNARTTHRGRRPQPNSDSRQDARNAKKTTRTPVNLGDLCVFARNLILCTSRPYVSPARKSAQENKSLKNSNAKENNGQWQIINNQSQGIRPLKPQIPNSALKTAFCLPSPASRLCVFSSQSRPQWRCNCE